MPRLLLVIDEFAMLAKDYPDVLSSLVSVGAVGRTLGVHMILATQRPAGVVNEDILANTNLRVALRVQSRDDSNNVIGVPVASAIGREQQGRAFIKLGQDDITPVQTAWSTAPVEQGDVNPLQTRPVRFGPPAALPKPAKGPSKSDETDLDRFIAAIAAASDAAGYAPPRKVWPQALGERVPLAGFDVATSAGVPDGSPGLGDVLAPVGGIEESTVVFGLSDDPDRQRQVTAGWDLERGNLLLVGIPGSGTSTTLASIALTMAAHWSPEELDVLMLDMGSRDLAPLAGLPHCVGYVGSGSAAKEQQVRFLKFVRAELDRRKSHGGPQSKMLVLIDGLAALKDEYQDFEGLQLLEGVYRAWADGPDVGMFFATTTTRAKAIPSAIDEITTQKWLFRLADVYDYTATGIKASQVPAAVAGRCVPVETRLQTHVATPGGDLPGAVAQVAQQWGVVSPKVSVVRQLPERVTVGELGVVAELAGEPWRVPVGLRESDLEAAWCELYEHEHMLVAGPARSGKSTTLLAIAQAVRDSVAATGHATQVWGIAGARSPLAGCELLDRVAGVDDKTALLAAARIAKTPLVLLIDDAEKVEDSDESIANLIAANNAGLHIIAAGRADDLRGMYSHWTKFIRKARCGVLLQPNPDYDGELLGAGLPRKPPVGLMVGRGYACNSGVPAFVQVAVPDILGDAR
jgi:S-DNA-T family DNA segregation ATPase FtsK/SpoIIIE